MEKELCQWISMCHEDRRYECLTQYNIIKKAREIQRRLYPEEDFTGSKGWFERFGNRNPEYLRLTLKHGKPRYSQEKGRYVKKARTRARKAETFSEHLAQHEENEDYIFVNDDVKEEAASNNSLVQIELGEIVNGPRDARFKMRRVIRQREQYLR